MYIGGIIQGTAQIVVINMYMDIGWTRELQILAICRDDISFLTSAMAVQKPTRWEPYWELVSCDYSMLFATALIYPQTARNKKTSKRSEVVVTTRLWLGFRARNLSRRITTCSSHVTLTTQWAFVSNIIQDKVELCVVLKIEQFYILNTPLHTWWFAIVFFDGQNHI